MEESEILRVIHRNSIGNLNHAGTLALSLGISHTMLAFSAGTRCNSSFTINSTLLTRNILWLVLHIAVAGY